MNIGVIGVGRLGLSFSLLCEKSGYTVFGSDTNINYIESLQKKRFKTDEPFIEEYLQNSKKIKFTTDNAKVISETDVIFTFVSTPSTTDGDYDHTYVDLVVSDFIYLHKNGLNLSGKKFVIGCTVNPGYTEKVQTKLEDLGVQVFYNPEFIRQGNIIDDLKQSDFILIGRDESYDTNQIKDIYKSFTENVKFSEMSTTAAEITKIGLNCYLTTKISFANMIGQICYNSGIENEISTVLETIGSDSRVGNKFLKFGFGFGGPCLPRDNRALGKHAEKIGLKFNIPNVIDEFNESHLMFLVNKILQENPNKNFPLIFDSITYKKGINITTDSQQLSLLHHLLELGYTCFIYETDLVRTTLESNLVGKYGTQVRFVNQDTKVLGKKIIL
jgi:nucleotide sugar dehydrogenase